MEEMKVKIAPDLEEIKRDGNVFSCEFNGMAVRWCVATDCENMSADTEAKLKQWLQTVIGMSGKMWQVPFLLNKNLPFASEVYVNGEKVNYPKD